MLAHGTKGIGLQFLMNESNPVRRGGEKEGVQHNGGRIWSRFRPQLAVPGNKGKVSKELGGDPIVTGNTIRHPEVRSSGGCLGRSRTKKP